MYYEIEKNVKIIEEEQEITEKYTVIFTSLNSNFAVSRYTLYGEEVLKEPIIYNISEDFLGVLGENVPNVNTFYYVHREHGDRLTKNFTVWQNGQKVYENLSETYQVRGEENVGDAKNYTSKEDFPVHPIEERTIEERQDYIIRPDRTHIYVRRKNIVPFSTDALIFNYNIPDAQVFAGYENIEEISQQVYEEKKTDIEGIYNTNENIFKIKETGEYYHLSSNGERVIETHLPFYKNYTPSFSTYSSTFSTTENDHYAVALSEVSRIGREISTIIQIPSFYVSFGVLTQFLAGITSTSDSQNMNYSYFKSLRGVNDFRVFSTNLSLNLIRWWNLFDGGFHKSAITSGAYFNGYNSIGGQTYDARTFEGVMPEFFEYNRSITNIF